MSAEKLTSFENVIARELAAKMLPELIARRFDYGRGTSPDEFFVEWSFRLAKEIILISRRKV